MASRKRQAVVGYAGVYFVEVPRSTGHGMEKVYYVRYRKQGKLIEEKVGGQYRDNMTAAKASSIRGLRMEGKDASNEEKRAAVRAAKMAEESRYSFDRLWSLFEEAKSSNRSIKDDRIRFNLHIAPSLGTKSIPELTIHDIDKLRAKLEKAGKSPQTVKHVLTLVKRILNFALQKGYVDSIPSTLRIIFLGSATTAKTGYRRHELVNFGSSRFQYSIAERIGHKFSGFFWFELFCHNNFSKVIFFLSKHKSAPVSCNLCVYIDTIDKGFNQFFLAAKLHTGIYCLTDRSENFLILTVALMILLDQHQYVVDIWIYIK